MQFTLKSDKAVAVVDSHAAEIHSFKLNNKDYEYMWCGNPEFWAGRNPILFPQVNSPADKIVVFDGKEYTMGNHGFARNSEFVGTQNSDNSVTMVLAADDVTLSQYPYNFELRVDYTLVDAKMNITYTITNKDTKVMPFGFGLHPAFNCPIDPTKTMNDYRFEFDKQEDYSLMKDQKIDLYRELFSQHIIGMIPDHKSSSVTLTDGENGVVVACDEFKMLMFWSPSTAPFVCIEPWLFCTDRNAPRGEFKDQKDIMFVEPGECKVIKTSYSIF